MKLIRLLFFVVALVVGVSIAISNRVPVTLKLEPIPYSVDLPLYVVIFACFLIGLLFGGLFVWWRDGRVRRRARRAEGEAGQLRKERDANEQALEEALHHDPTRSNQPALRGPEVV